jgi:hypothetical protein
MREVCALGERSAGALGDNDHAEVVHASESDTAPPNLEKPSHIVGRQKTTTERSTSPRSMVAKASSTPDSGTVSDTNPSRSSLPAR